MDYLYHVLIKLYGVHSLILLKIRSHYLLNILLLILFVGVYTSSWAEHAKITSPPIGMGFSQLIERMSKGGVIIYLRHAQTDHSSPDKRPFVSGDCSRQRNLDSEGRRQAELIGKQFRQYKIPANSFLSSPYCRCIDTAKIISGKLPLVFNGLSYIIGETKLKRNRLLSFLKKQMTTPLATGENRIIVSHTANLLEVANIWPEHEGDMIIFEPTTPPKYLGYIPVSLWDKFPITSIDNQLNAN
jgi:phosphohistidine phosphatase SixA